VSEKELVSQHTNHDAEEQINADPGLPDPDTLVRGMEPNTAPDPDPSIIKQK